MDIQQLRSVLQVAELKSFTKAARRFGISQPAISQQISRLEAELGRALFERQGRLVKLTPAGEIVRQQAEQIVALADDTARLLVDDGASGKLTISAIPTIAPYLLPSALSLFLQQHPQAQTVVNEEVTRTIVKRCVDGEIDVGLLALPVDHPPLQVEPLFEEELLLALPAGHRLAERKKLTVDDLRDEQFVLLDESHCLSSDIRSFCHRKRFQPISTGVTSQLTTVLELVGLGHGISFVPAMARKSDTSSRRIYRSLDGAKPKRTVAMCWNPQRYCSRLAQNWLELLRKQFGQL